MIIELYYADSVISPFVGVDDMLNGKLDIDLKVLWPCGKVQCGAVPCLEVPCQ